MNIARAKPKNYEAFCQPIVLGTLQQTSSAIQEVANKNFELLKADPKHPSLHLKKVGRYWSIRAGKKYRAVGVDIDEGIPWF